MEVILAKLLKRREVYEEYRHIAVTPSEKRSFEATMDELNECIAIVKETIATLSE